MSPRYRVTINGREHEVEIGDLASSPVEVTVDGVAYEVDLADRSLPARPVATQSAQRPAPAPPAPGAPTPGPASADNAITALLPGRIISVEVKVGEVVTVGQPVIVIESMKMEQTIASPREGTVNRVLVSPGDSVAYGETLVEFE